MSYGQFLLVFLVIPIGLLIIIQRHSLTRQNWTHLFVLMAVALIYTTPWDNYLVANQVWWYDPAKVSGIVLAYVPLEEYLFFLLQPMMTGLLLLLLRRSMRQSAKGQHDRPVLCKVSVLALALPWLFSVVLLLAGPRQARYLSLELAWALPPFMLQLAFGADLLARSWRPALLALFISTSYLIAADMWAISQGIWTISPEQTLGLNPFPSLVLEELVFFLVTNLLVIGGLSLLEEEGSLTRLRIWLQNLKARPGLSKG